MRAAPARLLAIKAFARLHAVLADPDLAAQPMAVLEPPDCAVRQVCNTRRTAWDATKEQRRLRSDDTYMSPDFPGLCSHGAITGWAADADRDDSGTRIVDKNLHTLQLLDEIGDPGDMAPRAPLDLRASTTPASRGTTAPATMVACATWSSASR